MSYIPTIFCCLKTKVVSTSFLDFYEVRTYFKIRVGVGGFLINMRGGECNFPFI